MNVQDIISKLNWIDSVAGGVWMGLTLIMCLVLQFIYRKQGPRSTMFKWGVFLMLLVWMYPLYTAFYTQMEIGMIGNIFTLGVTWIYFTKVRTILPSRAFWLLPQMLWLGIATVYVGLLLVDRWT